ncbi:MAG: hypothetical protein A2722_03500 [Candidatus Doudnabacteria bacterium RIFCSPHIGHO2_01_FULL_50_11]|uniref:Uncharacterized protein n=1 Tax=Candidatus Doudnabacteria bacterium RIFCSPHIGHO2_01_FULL_50_11 TaxID=1817828 RepID=A0A1F5PIF6_9BACT|nr:MAG: hypothetical protein A2722_03500 [Candidatus Doudnabacteria bacterium RIFCSPHIGHO2_01_FULL_50_11]HLC44390.1 DUF4258 domain-containing protein [Patescibacteria group bacterium]
MSTIFTRHSLKRMRKRNIGRTRASALTRGGKYLGSGTYKTTRKSSGRDITVIYKKEGSKRIIKTAWKE